MKKEKIITINPIESYYDNGIIGTKNMLREKDNEYLIALIKEYVPDSNRKIYKEADKEKLIDYIINKVGKLLNVGRVFMRA